MYRIVTIAAVCAALAFPAPALAAPEINPCGGYQACPTVTPTSPQPTVTPTHGHPGYPSTSAPAHPSPSTVHRPPAQLPQTGRHSGVLVAAGVLLLAIGVLSLAAARTRSRGRHFQ